MAGLPVTVRLLDPPLHEFLPQDAKSQAEMAKRLKITPKRVAAEIDKNLTTKGTKDTKKR